MSVKPLDLQVNINTLHIASQREGSRAAAYVASQRLMDEKVTEEAKRNLHKVNESPESTESKFLSEEDEHEKLVKDGNGKQHSQHEEKNEEQGEQKKQKSSSNSNKSIPKHLIDTTA